MYEDDALMLEQARCLRATATQLLIAAPTLDAPVWVPRVHLHASSQVRRPGDVGRLAVESWWGRRQGWT